MFTADSHDPVFLTRLRHEQPHLHPNHLSLIRLAHAEDLQALAAIDGDLEQLTARRRAVLERLVRYRQRLWPGVTGRHQRKTCRAEDNPIPPTTVGARPVWGSDLRRIAVAVLGRHGPQPLRELHGLIHRYGYVIDSRRPVQRLADAVAYEVRHGRLERIERGVYGPAADTDVSGRTTGMLGEPLPWCPPHPDRAVDPLLRHDPQRWSQGRWPADAQAGSDWSAGPPDPYVGELAEALDLTFRATRDRLAALYAERLGRPPSNIARTHRWSGRRPRPARPGRPPTGSQDPPPHPSPDALGDDSSTNRSPMGEGEQPGVGRGGGAGDGPPEPRAPGGPEPSGPPSGAE